MNILENNAIVEPKAAAAVRPADPPPFRRLANRCSGPAVSVLVHGGLALAAFLCVAAPGTGHGGGIVGRPDGNAGSPGFSALVQRSDTLSGERQADARAFEAPAEDPAPLEAVPPPKLDFLNEPAEHGVPVAKLLPRPETGSPARAEGAYSKLPPPPVSNPTPPGEGAPKGNSNVSGSGGDTGGAGDGTVGALYMPAPDYPGYARRKGIEGVVVVTIDVLPDGQVDHVQIVESSGCDALDDSALSAIRKWMYEPHPGGLATLRRIRFVFKLQK